MNDADLSPTDAERGQTPTWSGDGENLSPTAAERGQTPTRAADGEHLSPSDSGGLTPSEAFAQIGTPDVRDAVGRASARAFAEGAADVAYCEVDSPLGRLVAAGTERGLVRLAYEEFNGGLDAVLERIASRVSPRILEAPARLDGVRRQLDEYFEGGRRDFDVPLDWALTTGFTQKLLRATAAIPFGSLRSYAEVAAAAGSPKATRAAGNALSANPIPIIVPCHRVVRTGGKLGGYTGGLDKKETLLRLEGVVI